MKVYLSESELWPCYSISSPPPEGYEDLSFEADAVTVNRWAEICAAFFEAQREMDAAQNKAIIERRAKLHEAEVMAKRIEVGWADRAIEILRNGKDATIHPRGNSMSGIIESGDAVELTTVTRGKVNKANGRDLVVGDVVLVRVKGKVYLHLIKAIERQRYLIGNNRGGVNGWVGTSAIYGVRIKEAEANEIASAAAMRLFNSVKLIASGIGKEDGQIAIYAYAETKDDLENIPDYFEGFPVVKRVSGKIQFA